MARLSYFIAFGALVGLAPTPQAQTPSTDFGVSFVPSIPRPYGRLELGQVTEDGHPDGALVADGSVHLAYGLDAYNGAFDLGVPATDLCVLNGASPEGFGVIASTHASGSDLSWFDSGTDALVTHALSGLASARRLREGDTGGDGQADLFVLASDGLSFTWFGNLALTDSGGGNWSVSNSVTVNYPSSQAVVDFVPADLDAQPLADLVCLEAGAVARLRPNGTRTVLATFSGTPKAITAFREQGSVYDRIAVVYHDGTRAHLLVVDAVGTETLDLGGLDVVALTSGDIDQDGRDDLIASLGAGDILWHYRNTGQAGSTFQVGPSTAFLIDSDPSVAGSVSTVAWCAAADVDQDGDVDVVYPQESRGELFLGGNNRFDASTLMPQYVDAYKDYTPYTGTNDFDYRVILETPSGLPGNLDVAEVRVWKSDSVGPIGAITGYAMRTTSEASRTFLVGNSCPEGSLCTDGVNCPDYGTCTEVEVQADYSDFTGHTGDVMYVLFVRYIDKDGNNQVVDWSPCFALGFSKAFFLEQYGALTGYPLYHDEASPLHEEAPPGSGVGFGSGDVPIDEPPGWGGGGTPPGAGPPSPAP